MFLLRDSSLSHFVFYEAAQTHSSNFKDSLGWKDGSAVKSNDCSSRGPEFNSPLLVCIIEPVYSHKINKSFFKKKKRISYVIAQIKFIGYLYILKEYLTQLFLKEGKRKVKRKY